MVEFASKLAAREQAFSAAELVDRWKERRRFQRKSVLLVATMETPHGTVQCIALDLSLGGARIRIHEKLEQLEPLDRVTLTLEKFGRFPGHVVWRNVSEAGLQFSDTPEEVAVRIGHEFLRG